MARVGSDRTSQVLNALSRSQDYLFDKFGRSMESEFVAWCYRQAWIRKERIYARNRPSRPMHVTIGSYCKLNVDSDALWHSNSLHIDVGNLSRRWQPY